MLIIIEGIDKSGKTTLANYLVKNLDSSYFIKNGTKPKDGSMNERKKIVGIYNKLLETYRTIFRKDVLIVDRMLLSEYVYSFKRGYESNKDEELKEIQDTLENMGDVIFIYCSSDPKILAEKFQVEKEDFAKVDEIQTIMKRYETHISMLKGKIVVLPYDYTRITMEQVLTQLKIYKIQFDKDSTIGDVLS